MIPQGALESRTPRSIHFTPSEWAAVEGEARGRGLAPSAFARMLVMYALSIVQAPVVREASLGVPAGMLSGSRRFPENPAVPRGSDPRKPPVKAGAR